MAPAGPAGGQAAAPSTGPGPTPGPDPAPPEPGAVTVRLFAAARAAAGGPAILRVPAGPLDQLLADLRRVLPPRFGEVLAVSSVVSDGVRLDPDASLEVAPGAVLDVLPPFAGG